MINKNNFLEYGFDILNSNTYISSQEELKSFKEFQKCYEHELQEDGPRRRAYLKLEWNCIQDEIKLSENQSYFQTPQSNTVDGGKLRQFKVMNPAILNLTIVQRILQINKKIILNYPLFKDAHELVLGMHFIRYYAEKLKACYSSPVGLHIDDEPLVFVHLVQLTSNSLGGDNLIGKIADQEITNVIRLEKPMDTIILNKNCYHAVTPLGSKENFSIRDILLVTVEPKITQVKAA